jgi:hypothetical protein
MVGVGNQGVDHGVVFGVSLYGFFAHGLGVGVGGGNLKLVCCQVLVL